MAMNVDPDELEPALSPAGEGVDDDLTVDDLAFVMRGLPLDDIGLPKLAAISDQELRARFQQAARRKEAG